MFLVSALTVPLVTTAEGKKFGKSEGNAVWLRDSLTSAAELYRFLMETRDADLEKLLHYLTFLENDQIEELLSKHRVTTDFMCTNTIIRSFQFEPRKGDQ